MFARFPTPEGPKLDVNPTAVAFVKDNGDGSSTITTITGFGLVVTASTQAVRGGLKRALAAQTGVAAEKDPSEV